MGGALSQTVRADRAALRDYFVTAFKVLPRLKVVFGDQLIRVYDATAVNTGFTHFLTLGTMRPRACLRATASLNVKRGENWLIVDHHFFGHATSSEIVLCLTDARRWNRASTER